jgi:uncharacterized protein (TIGR00730 family)
VAHTELSELILCETMHERKHKMMELSEGFIALPGGFGTLEELFEVLTWQQLGLHQKPIGILNVGGFYNSLKDQVEMMTKSKLLSEENKRIVLFAEDSDELLAKMGQYQAPIKPKWIKS